MRRIQVSLTAIVALILAGVLVNMRPIVAQQPVCLHGSSSTSDQLARRQGALYLTRLINGLEHESLSGGAYQPLAQLAITAIPAGFAVHLTSDGQSYAFSVKDTLDPCHFGFFSDQDGMIYAGEVIR
jgi:hypothetical protein